MVMQVRDPKLQPFSANSGDADASESNTPAGWLKRARSAYLNSTNYVDSNYRKNWDDSIRAFNNEHSGDSKYNSASFEKRSKIYRPKTRQVIRKNEAAAAAAFFSNMDVVDITPMDSNSKDENASAAVLKELLQYRLTKTIPWFQIVLGGLQDAQTIGVAIAHVYWEYKPDLDNDQQEPTEEEPKEQELPKDENEEYPLQSGLPKGTFVMGEDGKEQENANSQENAEKILRKKPLVDKPVVELIPVENIRISPDANWIDPINTSPFIIHLIPMYVMDVKAKMESGEWYKLSDSTIRQAVGNQDSTRASRQKGRDDPMDGGNNDVDDYELVWVQRHIHRQGHKDYEFYTLGTLAILCEPLPLEQIVFHGKRPYVMGSCILETHKIYPSSVPQLGKGLQEEANEIANQRLDNVKLVLNKKWFVKRGRDADLGGLVRNVPGGIVMLEDPANDVREINWPDVTQSAYEEQNRVDRDLDELLGAFSPSQLMADRQMNAPARNMALLSSSSGTMTEYLLKTFSETFILPVLRQLLLLEQKYENDDVIIAIAAKKAQVLQRFGVNSITDNILEQELNLNVNVGMGATDPMQKLNKFISGISAYSQIIARPVPGLDLQEVGKEIFGHMGYSDGSRFFNNQDPQVAYLTAQLQQAQQQIQQLTGAVKEKQTIQQTHLARTQMHESTALEKTKIHEQNENKRALAAHIRALAEVQQQGGEQRTGNEDKLKLIEMSLAHQRGMDKNKNDLIAKLHGNTMKGQQKPNGPQPTSVVEIG
jgi:DNA-binding phage protein